MKYIITKEWVDDGYCYFIKPKNIILRMIITFDYYTSFI